MSTLGLICFWVIVPLLYLICGALIALTSFEDVFDDYTRLKRIICRILVTLLWPLIIIVILVVSAYSGLKWLITKFID